MKKTRSVPIAERSFWQEEECRSTAVKNARIMRIMSVRIRDGVSLTAVEPLIDLGKLEYLTFAKAALLMGCSRQYIYKIVREGKLPASRLSCPTPAQRPSTSVEIVSGHNYWCQALGCYRNVLIEGKLIVKLKSETS